MTFEEFNKMVCEIMDVDHQLTSSEYDFIYGLCGTELDQFNRMRAWGLARLKAVYERVCDDDS